MTKLPQKFHKTKDGILVFPERAWESGRFRIGFDYLVIGETSVKAGISGTGKCILRPGLENEAEYEEFENEIEYSFKELGVSADTFFMLTTEDMIEEIISLTENKLKNEY